VLRNDDQKDYPDSKIKRSPKQKNDEKGGKQGHEVGQVRQG
jgi:hypothetical protein